MIFGESKLFRFFLSLKPSIYSVEIDEDLRENVLFEDTYRRSVTAILMAIVTHLSSINQFYIRKKLGVDIVNPFMRNSGKWPNILLRSCRVNTARFLKYVWSFFNIKHERVKNNLQYLNKCYRRLVYYSHIETIQSICSAN